MKVTACRIVPEKPYTLELTFQDGTRGEVFLGNMLEVRGFGAWQNPEIFNRVNVDPETGAVVWECRIALDPEVLYRDVQAKRLR